jgi:hypothetical protein
MKFNLLNVSSNAKTLKSDKLGEYLTGILYLSPYKISGINTCPFASDGCSKACLNTAGRGAFNNVQQARIRKTHLFFENRDVFFYLLIQDIEKLVSYCEKNGLKPCLRLNGTSDIPFENYQFTYKGIKYRNIMSFFPNVTFYDYTKYPVVYRRELPPNYSLTFSRSEKDNIDVIKLNILYGRNVAIVFRNYLPETYEGIEVIDGDKHDLRFLDKKGVIVGLKAKGLAKTDETGFILDAEESKLIKLGKSA